MTAGCCVDPKGDGPYLGFLPVHHLVAVGSRAPGGGARAGGGVVDSRGGTDAMHAPSMVMQMAASHSDVATLDMIDLDMA